jgi:flagellar biosynthesis chaperone FliJ
VPLRWCQTVQQVRATVFQASHDRLTTELSELKQQHFELENQLRNVTAERQQLLNTVARASSEASAEESALRKTISDLTSAREQEKKEV